MRSSASYIPSRTFHATELGLLLSTCHKVQNHCAWTVASGLNCDGTSEHYLTSLVSTLVRFPSNHQKVHGVPAASNMPGAMYCLFQHWVEGPSRPPEAQFRTQNHVAHKPKWPQVAEAKLTSASKGHQNSECLWRSCQRSYILIDIE